MKNSKQISGLLCIGLLIGAGAALAEYTPPRKFIPPGSPLGLREAPGLKSLTMREVKAGPEPIVPPNILAPTKLSVVGTAFKTGPSEGASSTSFGGALVGARGGAVYSPKQATDRRLKSLIRRLD